jgi:DNA (cytosine-5)-methyltransferase 1
VTYGSVCSGIEAATVAWEPLGFDPAWFAEIDPFCSALLEYRYPHVANLGDFTQIDAPPGTIDVLVGGTPCQSFSVAGKRGGLDDARGNLALEFCRLAGRLRPRWIVWENVPGVLSSNGGRDFGSILGALAELGYGCAWRVLDAQFFGVPQRRRRLFVVGHLGDWRRAAAVLLERESLCRDTPARRKARKEVAGALGGGAGERGWCNDLDRMTFVPEIAYALNSKGASGRLDAQSNETFVAQTQPIGFSAKDSGADLSAMSPALHAMARDRSNANGGGQVAVCVQEGQTGVREHETAGTVRSDAPGSQAGGSLIRHRMAVRRLTPRECERLQGFPDDYTLIPYRGKPAPDGPRYRAIGNSMAVPVMRWIGRRIQMVEAIRG